MTMADVVAHVQQIQSRLALLAPVRTSATASSSATAASATGFSDALATATTATTGATGVTGAELTGTAVTGDDVVKAAEQYEGVPYVLGGESKSGIDCSGLVQAAFKDLGVDVPRTVTGQKTIGEPVASLKDAKPGDLIVLNGGDHIAIYAGNDTVVHAPYAGRTVSVQKAWFTDKDIVSIRRVVPSGDEAATTAATTATAVPSSSTSSTTTSTSTGTTGLSAATLARAVGLVGMYGATGSDDSSGSSSSSSSSSSLTSLLGQLSGSTGTSSTSTTQQLLAARAAMLNTESA